MIAVYLQKYSYLSCYKFKTFLFSTKTFLDYAALYGTKFVTRPVAKVENLW